MIADYVVRWYMTCSMKFVRPYTLRRLDSMHYGKLHTISAHLLSQEGKTVFLQRIANAEMSKSVRPASGEKRNSAVLVPLLLTHNGEPCVLFTRRSRYLSAHSGEISFPGGRMDNADATLVDTALREAEEEVGLARHLVDVWSTLPGSLTAFGESSVTPVVGTVASSVDWTKLIPHDAEVAEVFVCTLERLCDSNCCGFTQFRIPPRPAAPDRIKTTLSGLSSYSMPLFHVNNYRIWGLTAIILHQTLKLLLPDVYKPKLKFLPRMS